MLEINYHISRLAARLSGIISKPNFSPLSLNNSPCVTSWLTGSLHFLNWYLVATEGSWEYLEGQPGTCEKTPQLGVGSSLSLGLQSVASNQV